MAAPVPAGTIAALAVIWPSAAFNVETKGWPCPEGHVVKNPSDPSGTAVKLAEYA